MDDKNYKIKSGPLSYYNLVVALFLVAVGIMFWQSESKDSLQTFGIIYALLGIIYIYRFLNTPHEIVVEDDLVFFNNWLKKENSAYIKDFKSIHKRFGNILVVTENKRIRMFSGFKNFKKFVDDVKAKNPRVEVRGKIK